MHREDFPNRIVARSTDPDTSHAGLAKMPFNAIKQRVIDYLGANPPAHSVKIALDINERLVCVSPVLRPLERLGVLKEAGKAEGKILWTVA